MIDRDERLAGWLDGALPSGEADAFEVAMARDPALAQQAEAWRGNDALLRSAFEGPVAQGIDAQLLARMGLQPVAANDNPSLRRWAWPLGGAIAAGLALALVLAGNPLGSAAGQDSAAQFAAAMEQLPSRGQRALGDGGKVSPVLSFAAADGRFCREFSITGGTGPGRGIACKGASGWAVEVRSAEGNAPVPHDRIVLADGGSNGALDAAFERLGASDALSAEAEWLLIARGWRK